MFKGHYFLYSHYYYYVQGDITLSIAILLLCSRDITLYTDTIIDKFRGHYSLYIHNYGYVLGDIGLHTDTIIAMCKVTLPFIKE